MRTRTTAAAITTALTIALTGCATETTNASSDSATAKASPSAKPTAENRNQGLDVRQVADTLNKDGRLGDQTEAPVEKSDHPNAELGRVDTDRVIIYEMKTAKAATTRVKAMEDVDYERPQHAAGRFVLSWRTDDVPSSKAFMDEVNNQADDLTATER